MEDSIDEYFGKKDDECSGQREHHGDLFDERARDFVRKQKITRLRRHKVIGDELVTRWEKGPDDPEGYFKEMIDLHRLGGQPVDLIRDIPARIRSENKAVTWPAISVNLKECNHPKELDKLQPVMQHFYLGEYLTIEAYDLAVLTDLPFSTGLDFGLCRGDFAYNWRVLQQALWIAGCWDTVRTMSAMSMLHLRATPGFFAFRDAVVEVGAQSKSVQEACKTLSVMTWAMGNLKDRDRLQSLLRDYKKKAKGTDLTRQTIEALDCLLGAASAGLNKYGGEFLVVKESVSGGWAQRSQGVAVTQTKQVASVPKREDIPVAIFCALEEEREYLIERWDLKPQGETEYWCGSVGDVNFLLYTADQMGRVPAALATMRFLSSFAPKNIIVAGIAGGFESEDVEAGHLLIPSLIADLAGRKIRQDEGGARPQFRPNSFNVGQKTVRHLNGAQFQAKKADWEALARREGEWQKGRIPALHIGCTIASTDEVVSSNKWVQDHLLKAWPKLKGIEMEAGGVCAAAIEMGDVPVTVIRGVSDLADPLKANDGWRKCAMKTLATLVEVLLRDKVFQ
jgi:nucleoside phosphorylase